MTSLTIAGTRLRVHPLFFLLLFVLVWAERIVQGLTVFAVVVLHEFGHVAAARGYGVDVTEVELLPFGGVARIDGLIETDPSVEAGIAMAGPLTNVFLLVLGFALSTFELADAEWVRFFVWTNVVIIGVNAVPALPLDGGRLYRAYRSRRIGYRKATYESIRLGRALAVLMLLGGIAGVYFGFVNATLPVLALFVLIASGKEQRTTAYVFMAYLARKQTELATFGSMEAESLAARTDATVEEVVERFIPEKFHLIWVVDGDGRPVGIATEGDVLDAFFDSGPGTPLAVVRQQRLIDRK